MGWLRRDKDCIALVLVWALLVQAAILSFTSGAHAATLASGEKVVLCTLKGALLGKTVPGQSRQKADHPCCVLSCRMACSGMGNTGLIPLALRVPLPASIEARAAPLPRLAPLTPSPDISLAQPRAPPLS
jgi:hypothetical protein